MTIQEALEYLNLPINSSEQLVQKRYLELKKDYQKAINNAPSDHFSTLYQENLDKIKEAYMLLMEDQEAIDVSDSKILYGIQQVQRIVDTLVEDEGDIDPEARVKIKNYIEQISSFQDDLREEKSHQKPSKIRKPSEMWDMKVKSPADNQEVQGESKQESDSPFQEDQAKETLITAGDSGSDLSQITDTKSDTHNEPVSHRGWRWEIKAFKHKVLSWQDKEIDPDPEPDQSTTQKSPESAFIEKWVIETILNSSFATTSVDRKQYYNQLIMRVILIILSLCVIGAIYILFPLL